VERPYLSRLLNTARRIHSPGVIRVTKRGAVRYPRFREAAATTVGALATLDHYRSVHILNMRSGVIIHVEGVQSDENGRYTTLDDLERLPGMGTAAVAERVL